MSLKVLLLEEDVSLTRELEHALAMRSCEVVTVADVEEGLGVASSQHFDVILISTERTDANGYDLSDRIRRNPATAGASLVVMSKPVVIPDLIASLPERPPRAPSVMPSLAPSGDLRETIKNQGRVVASLRADLATRSKTIDTLTTRCKDLTQRLTDVLALLEEERKHRESASEKLDALRQTHAAEVDAVKQTYTSRINALEATLAAEIADRDRAHAEETAFLERAQQDAADAAARRLVDSERVLAAERQTYAADAEAHAHELATMRRLAEDIERERDEAIRERDEARARLEAIATDVARIADLESEIAALRASLAAHVAESERIAARTHPRETELAEAVAKAADLARALETAERDAIQAQLARDAAFHDLQMRATAELDAAVNAVKEEMAKEREELLRANEQAIKVARDKAIAQTLAVARERKKQQS